MKQVQRKILIHRQNNTFSNRNDSIRLSSHNSERPGTEDSIRREINCLKLGQERILQGQERIVQGQERLVQGQQSIVQGQVNIVSVLNNIKISIDNLALQIGKLAQINKNGNNSKKNSLNQSLYSDFSKHSSGTAIYVKRNEAKNTNEKEDNTEQEKEIPKPKVNQITDFRHYSKVNRKTK